MIVEINLLHHQGGSETKHRVIDMIRDLAGETSLNEALASDTEMRAIQSV